MLICLFSLNGLSRETIETLQRKRKQNRNSFLNHAHQTTSCAEEVQKLSVQANTISENISKNTKTCGSFISKEDDYNKCVKDISKIRTYLKNLKSNVANTKSSCPLFSVNDKQLESSLNAIESSVYLLGEGMGYWLRATRKIDSSIYNDNKYKDCATDILRINYPLGFFSTGVFTSHYVSDMYRLEKKLLGVRIYGDYSQAIVEACIANEDQTDRMQEINEVKAENEQIQKEVSEDINKYSNYSFDELSSKKCKAIKKRNINVFGLCENPMNTPSWKYSIHHIYDSYLKKKKEEDA